MRRLQPEGSERGLVALLRALRVLRRIAMLNRRPVVPAIAARQRYEPMMEALAAHAALSQCHFARSAAAP